MASTAAAASALPGQPLGSPGCARVQIGSRTFCVAGTVVGDNGETCTLAVLGSLLGNNLGGTEAVALPSQAGDGTEVETAFVHVRSSPETDLVPARLKEDLISWPLGRRPVRTHHSWRWPSSGSRGTSCH